MNDYKHIVQSANPNAPLAMAYQAGQAQVVKMLKSVVKVGLQDESVTEEDETLEGIEYGR